MFLFSLRFDPVCCLIDVHEAGRCGVTAAGIYTRINTKLHALDLVFTIAITTNKKTKKSRK